MGNGEWGMGNGEWGMMNDERGMRNRSDEGITLKISKHADCVE